MPRRALRKINPDVDLSGRLLPGCDALPRPATGFALFGREASLEVEVGCGKGLFLEASGAARPDTDFLGIEVAAKYAAHSAARAARRELNNVRVLHGDALRAFREFFADASLTAVHVYFPDPWWKARHKKRRVLNEPFLHDVERTLRPDGALHFWTDVEEYYLATLELAARTTRLAGPIVPTERPAEHDLDYRTHFERRTRLHSQPVYRAEFRKPA